MKVDIVSMTEFVTFPAPGQREVVVRTTYRTETGYMGTIDIPKDEFSEEKVLEEIAKEIPAGTELIGTTVEIEGTKEEE